MTSMPKSTNNVLTKYALEIKDACSIEIMPAFNHLTGDDNDVGTSCSPTGCTWLKLDDM